MSRRTPEELAYAAAWVRERRERFKREGLCADCGQDKPQPGRVSCERCLEGWRRRQKERWHRDKSALQVRQEYYARHRAEGLCSCGRERMADHSECERCLAQHRERKRRWKTRHGSSATVTRRTTKNFLKQASDPAWLEECGLLLPP